MAQILKQVIGHKEIINSWLEDKKNDRLHHAILLAGPSGIGKKKVARGFAQVLLCERDQSGCGECSSCLRVENGVHESMLFVPEDHGSIKVETSGHIRDFLSLQKISKARVIIIERADLFLPAAANMILKTLEEPPEDTYFFLIAPSAFHLLPTLRSRVITMRFAPLSFEEMKNEVSVPDWAMAASRGRFDRLENFKNDELKIERMEQANLLRDVMVESDWLLMDWRKGLPAKAQWTGMLEFWMSLLRDVLVLKLAGKKQLVNPDQSSVLKDLQGLDLALIERACVLVLGFLGRGNIHRDPVLLLEEFYLKLKVVRTLEVNHVV